MEICNSASLVEVIPDRLYWISDIRTPRGQERHLYFCIDNVLKYVPFYSDFGPLNLGMTHRYIIELKRVLKAKEYEGKKIFHYTGLSEENRANSAYLMAVYCVKNT